MAHTPGPWAVHEDWDDEVWAEGGPWIAELKEPNGINGELIALAPTAPHDCDLPNCPGAVTKRKLEAAEKLLAACREAERISMAVTGAGTQADRLDDIYRVVREAIEAYERSL